jgi:hypothetical protein
LTRNFFNGTAASVDITEAGISMLVGSSSWVLMVRDVFTPITVANGQTITWTYTTEVAFPNP